MSMPRLAAALVTAALSAGAPIALAQQPAAPQALYNTAKQKLKDGKQVVGGTVINPDPDIYCVMATSGFDFLWIEMQHSPTRTSRG